MATTIHIANSFAWISQLATPCVLIVREMSPEDLLPLLASQRTSLLIDDSSVIVQILQPLHLSHYTIALSVTVAPKDSVVVAVGDIPRYLILELT